MLKAGSNETKTIALVDAFWSGHHPTYLKFFSSALLQLGHRVMVFCPEPERLTTSLEDPVVKTPGAWWAMTYKWTFEPSPNRSRLQSRTAALNRLRHLNQVLNQAECAIAKPIDIVFFCLIDDFIAHLQTAFDFNRLLGRQFTGLYFRPFHLRVRPPYSWFRKGPFNPDAVLFSHYCRSVAVLDEGIAKMLSRRLNDKLVVCFPDVTDGEVSESPTDLEREVKYKAKGRRIVGLLGSLDRRKGLLTFIRHATEMKNEPIFFLIAGKIAEHSFTEEENRTLNRIMKCPPENVFAHPGFVKDGIPFNSLVRACELLYVVYHDFPHSSNLLTKAACMNVPIVASDRYLIADRVRRFSLGFLVRENVPEDFHDLILSGKAFQLKGERKFMIGCQEYSKQHGFMKLVSCFKQLLAEY